MASATVLQVKVILYAEASLTTPSPAAIAPLLAPTTPAFAPRLAHILNAISNVLQVGLRRKLLGKAIEGCSWPRKGRGGGVIFIRTMFKLLNYLSTK